MHYEREQCQWLDTVGLGRPVPFAANYQPLPLLREVRRERLQQPSQPNRTNTNSYERESGALKDLRGVDMVRWEETLRGEVVTYETITVDELFAGDAQENREKGTAPRFVVLGPPGSGKSTFLQRLAWRALEGELRGTGQPLIPVRIRLRDWEAWGTAQGSVGADLLTYLTERHKNLPNAPTVEQWRQWVHAGMLFLLLDGLDEIDSTPMFLPALRNALLLCKTCPIVMSCRTVSFAQHKSLCPDFSVFTLGGLLEDQQAAYVHALFATQGTGEIPQRFINHLRSHPQLKALVTNPLLLNVLCYLTDTGMEATLPATRGELYKQALTKLLSKVPRRVEVCYPGEEPSVDEKLATLQRAAFHLFTQDSQRLTFTTEDLGADILGRMGARAVEHQEALSALVQGALHDVDNGVRSEAMRALAQIGEVAAQHPQVFNALVLAIQNDRDAGVRAQAARALESMTSVFAQRTDLLANLLATLRDEDTYVRYRAAIALASIMAHGVRFFRRWWGKIEARRVEDLL